MITYIQKWGNSQGIRIPKAILDSVNWSDKEELNISTVDDKIIIEKVHKRKNIIELFDGYNEEYKLEEMEWESPVGKEIW